MDTPSKVLIPRRALWPFVLLTSCFAWWGLANNMTDTLLAAFKRIMSLSDFQTSWIQIAFYGSYFCLALPAALFVKKWTYKAGVLLGLGLFVCGALLFFPASKTMSYAHFLLALYILAGGLSILETAANPYIIAMGPEESGTRRLNFAQSFNPIGSILGVFLSKWFILSELNRAGAEDRAAMSREQLGRIQSEELAAVMEPYVAVALFLTLVWVLIAATRWPRAADSGGDLELAATVGRLIRVSRYRWGVAAQFFYVGAQIGVWSFTIRYVMLELGLNEDQAASYYLAALILFTVSRFVNTWLMRFLSPGALLCLMSLIAMGCTLGVILAGGPAGVYALVGISGCMSLMFPTIFGCTLGVILAGGPAGVYALVGISGCMSLMFPTIFGLSVQGLGEDTKIGGAGLIMAILGGAVLTALQGQVSDMTGSIRIAYAVPLACFLVTAWFGGVVCPRGATSIEQR